MNCCLRKMLATKKEKIESHLKTKKWNFQSVLIRPNSSLKYVCQVKDGLIGL